MNYFLPGDKINNIHFEYVLTYVKTITVDNHLVYIFKNKDNQEVRLDAQTLTHYKLI